MRLKQNELVEIKLYRSGEDTSDYVGTDKCWVDSGTVLCQCQPAENHYTVELYGTMVKDMKTLYFEKEVDVDEKCGFSFNLESSDPEYTVKSIKDYSTHKVVFVYREN